MQGLKKIVEISSGFLARILHFPKVMKVLGFNKLPIKVRVLLYIITLIGSFIFMLGIISETILRIQFQNLTKTHIIRDIELVHKLLKAETD
jgi:sensor domain CHASE-containing protein